MFARASVWVLGDLPACAGDKSVVSLPPLSLLSLQYQHRQDQGLDFYLSFALPVEALCMWSTCEVAPQQRQWELLFSEEAAHLAASPDPASDPRASLLTLVVRKTLVGKSLGDTHRPYLLPVVTAWVGIVYLLPPCLPEKHFWKANLWFWKLRIKEKELLNNLSLYKMYVAMHILTCFSEYKNLLSLELNIDTDKAVSIFISQVNTFLYSPQHTSICAYYYYNVCPSAAETCMWLRGKREVYIDQYSSPILNFIRCFILHMAHTAALIQANPLLMVVTLYALNTGLSNWFLGNGKLTFPRGRGSKTTASVS